MRMRRLIPVLFSGEKKPKGLKLGQLVKRLAALEDDLGPNTPVLVHSEWWIDDVVEDEVEGKSYVDLITNMESSEQEEDTES